MNPLVADVDVVPATAREDDRQVIEPEVVLQEVKQSKESVLASSEHLGVGGLGGIDRRQVIGVQIEDDVRPAPVLGAHRPGPRVGVSAGRKVDVPWSFPGEERFEVAHIQQ